MQVFQTDENGFLVGATVADESPLEPGIFHIPRGCVEVVPPEIGVNQCAHWNGAAWDLLPDHRGRVYWLADHTRHVIGARGETKPADAFDEDPPKTAAELEAEDSAAAKRELVALDLSSIRDIRAYIAAKADAPQLLKDREASAIAARARVKP